MLDDIRQKLDEVVQGDAERGLFRCKRNIFTDPELFELEMRHIFEGKWTVARDPASSCHGPRRQTTHDFQCGKRQARG